MLPFVLAATLVAAPLDADHRALLAVLSHGDDAAGCDDAQRRAAATDASVRRLGALAGDPVLLAEVHNPCICGAQNCPYFVIRLAPGAPRVLYAAYGIDAKTIPAVPLPQLVVRAHDSALVVDETTAAYRNGRYVELASARVRADNGARKANLVPLRFAPGASSAVLRGSASTGWYDEYAFDATKGQRLTIDAVQAAKPISIAVLAREGSAVADVTPGKPYTLPKSGSYVVHVELASDSDVPYALTLAIR